MYNVLNTRPEMMQKYINMQIYERDNGFKETWPMGIFKRKYLPD